MRQNKTDNSREWNIYSRFHLAPRPWPVLIAKPRVRKMRKSSCTWRWLSELSSRDVISRKARPSRHSRENGENGLLTVGHFPFDTARHVGAWSETHGHAAAGVLDLRRWQTGGRGQLPHLDRPPTPLLDDATEVEDPRDPRVPEQRLMRLEQRLGVSPKCSGPEEVTSRRSS